MRGYRHATLALAACGQARGGRREQAPALGSNRDDDADPRTTALTKRTGLDGLTLRAVRLARIPPSTPTAGLTIRSSRT